MEVLLIEHFLNRAWPALEVIAYDNWSLRFAEGLTKRSNSVNLSPNNSIPVSQKIDFCEAVYRQKNLPVCFKLIGEKEYEHIEKELRLRGYIKSDEALVMSVNLARNDFAMPKNVTIENQFTVNWIDNLLKIISTFSQHEKIYRRVLARIQGDVICAYVAVDNEAIAFGYGYIEELSMGIVDVYVDKAHRGKGYGRQIVDALLHEGKKRTNIAYLQVIKDNYKAVDLYRKLGFESVYSYWYRIKEDDD